MTLLQTIFLGVMQGITEFFPISSSGHLFILKYFFGLQDVPLAYDVLLHTGSLIAIVIYFHKEWLRMAQSLFLPKDSSFAPDRKLLLAIALGTIPVIAVGPFAKEYLEQSSSLELVLASFTFSAIVFIIAERWSTKKQPSTEITTKRGVIVGLGQVIGLLPGVSRSGITMSSGLFSGMDRTTAARFSFLLGTPAIAGATILEAKVLLANGSSLGIYAIGALVSMVVSLLSITVLLKIIRKFPLWYFSLYLISLVMVLLFVRG
jgi:undecaprenyl-diphosphatase